MNILSCNNYVQPESGFEEKNPDSEPTRKVSSKFKVRALKKREFKKRSKNRKAETKYEILLACQIPC